ncbi:unnamed protein product [Agarophyton chilense]|eukprot:gb/GEZJ01001283.1/.p1 GENE.gb/GEZJ01001283.1/~~gb/GEZJ01001283.1/.p1  ORF type:complete len:703 (+),score=102.86 gb/GEZJ01001283.1/:114-2111(+)
MEPPAAARFLTAPNLLLALAASIPAIARTRHPFYPPMHALVTSPPPHSHLLHALSALVVHVNPAAAAPYLSQPVDDAPLSLLRLLVALLRRALSSPHALTQLLRIVEQHTDADLLGAYQPDSRITLFLRKVVVAFHSLSFESLVRLQHALHNHYPPTFDLSLHAKRLADSHPLPNPVFEQLSIRPRKPSPLSMLTHLESARRADFSTALAAAHRHFDTHAPQIPSHHAALALGILHARFSHKSHASAALRDALRCAQAAGDAQSQNVALQWLARMDNPEQASSLLRHAHDDLALVRHQLLTDSPPPPSAFSKLRNSVDALLLSASAWQLRAAVPTALCVARAALARAEKHEPLPESVARATVTVAELTALEGDHEPAMAMLEQCIKRLERPPDCSTAAPEIFMLQRSLTMLRFEASVRAMQLSDACALCDRIKAFALCSASNALAFSAEDVALDAIQAHVKCLLMASDTRGAADEALNLARKAAVSSRPERVVTGLTMRAEAFLNSGEAGGAFSDALAAVSLASAMRLDSAHVKASLAAAEAMLRMDSPASQVLEILVPVLPRALDGLGCDVRSYACRLHAECLTKKCDENGSVPDEKVVRLVQQALDGYRASGHANGIRDCLYMLARIHNWRNEIALRNRMSCLFRQHVHGIGRRKTPSHAIET